MLHIDVQMKDAMILHDKTLALKQIDCGTSYLDAKISLFLQLILIVTVITKSNWPPHYIHDWVLPLYPKLCSCVHQYINRLVMHAQGLYAHYQQYTRIHCAAQTPLQHLKSCFSSSLLVSEFTYK